MKIVQLGCFPDWGAVGFGPGCGWRIDCCHLRPDPARLCGNPEVRIELEQTYADPASGSAYCWPMLRLPGASGDFSHSLQPLRCTSRARFLTVDRPGGRVVSAQFTRTLRILKVGGLGIRVESRLTEPGYRGACCSRRAQLSVQHPRTRAWRPWRTLWISQIGR